jgi:hypothetical protein
MADQDTLQQLALNIAMNQRAMMASNFRNWAVEAYGPGSDNKRSQAWREYGWPAKVDFDKFYNLYDRQGVAYGVVHKLNEKCFETSPWVIQGDEFDEKKEETPWEKTCRLLAKKTKLWRAFREADVMRMVGKYSGILLRVADGKAWDQPITESRPVIRELIPAWEGQLEPVEFFTDTNDERYGEPEFWQFNEGELKNDKDEKFSPRNLKVHPDRIIILGNFRTGRSFLQANYNDFVNMEKIAGGSGEGFLKNASARTHVGYDKDVNLGEIARNVGLKDVSQLQDKFNQQAHDLNNGMDRLLITQGANVSQLVAAVPAPTPHYGVSLQNIAAGTRIPAKVIVGMQTGERASSEDIKEFNARAQGRRINVLTDDGDQIIEHLIRIGALESGGEELTFMWDDLTEASTAEKLEAAAKLATINKDSMGNGEAPPFDTNEIREAAGYDAKSEAELTLPDDQDVPVEPVVPAPTAPAAV